MNAKVKLDLYRLSLKSFRKAMVIGVDIVNQGSRRIIGISASYNQYLT